MNVNWALLALTAGAYPKVKGGDQVNINTSDITITIQCDRGRQRATKHLHLAMKGESSREQEGIQLVANAPFVLLH